jgi:MinD superfamily P-loop ATPase
MLIACWSAKGGSGTTVVATALALVLAENTDNADVVLVDLAGDVPAVLGLPEPDGPGITDWLVAGPEVGAEGLARLAVDAAPGVRVLPRGRGEIHALVEGGIDDERLVPALTSGAGLTVVDCGLVGTAPSLGRAVATVASLSLLVTRPCYLALRRALAVPLRPSAAVVVDEAGRALHHDDVAAVLDVPVTARVPFDPSISRAVDAGLLAHRVPARLGRPLRRAVR